MSESLVIKKPSLKYQEKTFDFNYNFFDDEGYLDLTLTMKYSQLDNSFFLIKPACSALS